MKLFEIIYKFNLKITIQLDVKYIQKFLNKKF